MIAFLSPFPPYRGGISRFSDHMYRSLSARTSCTAYGYRNLYPPLVFPGKSQISPEAAKPYAQNEVHAYNPLSWRRSGYRIAAGQPDMFIYSNWHPFFAAGTIRIIKALKKKHAGVKIAGVLHNVIPHERFPFQDRLSQSLFSLTDYPVVLSSQTREEFERLETGRQPIQLFHPVYDQSHPKAPRGDILSKLGLQPADKIVLFFGLIRKYKGLDVMIRALNELDLEKMNIRPVIAGEFYIPKEPLLDLIKPEHRSRYIIIDRFVSDAEAAEILSVADVMVLPYLTASQSGVLSNAVNFDLPVITSDLPGLTDHITEGKNGLIFRSGDALHLTQKLSDYFSSRWKEKMSEGMKSLKNDLSWDTFTEKFLDLTR